MTLGLIQKVWKIQQLLGLTFFSSFEHEIIVQGQAERVHVMLKIGNNEMGIKELESILIFSSSCDCSPPHFQQGHQNFAKSGCV